MNYYQYVAKHNPLIICPEHLLKEHFGFQAQDYLPVDTGIEIECDAPKGWDKSWLNLPGVIDNQSTRDELRLRIKPGLDGFKTVWDICDHLNRNNYILTESAIHYHIDISGHEQNIRNVAEDHKLRKFCRDELLSWDHVNSISGDGFVFFKKNNTIEIRCGKMTFNYSEMIKDIIWSHYIVKYVKEYAMNIDIISFQDMLKIKQEMDLKAKDLIKHRFIPFAL